MSEMISSLNVIDVAAPCSVDWDTMTGDEQVRHCQQCDMNVYNLSEMSEGDALKLVNQREGRLCIQFYRRTDGTLLTKDCPVGLKAIRKAVRQKVARMWAATAALGGAIFLGGIFGRSASGDQPAPQPAIPEPDRLIQMVKGQMCVTPPSVPQVQLTFDGLKMTDAKTVKQYLGRCLAREEQASYGMPDPDDMNALEENVRQQWQTKVDDPEFLPQPGTKEHGELSKITAELLKKHPEIALQIMAPQLQIKHDLIRGKMMIRPEVELPR